MASSPAYSPCAPELGCNGEGVIAGDLAELVRQILDDLRIAERLIRRREGMNLGEFRPGDRQHLGRGVELHRAGAERNHGAIEREVAIREAAHVARHFAFSSVHVKDRMSQIRGLANERRGQSVLVGYSSR